MSSTPSKEYGAAGIGCTARFDVEIDEALDDPNDVQMGIIARGWSFCFALSSRDAPAQMLSFLRAHTGRLEMSELVVGTFHGTPVRLVKDREFGDRFWLQAYGNDDMVSFALAADDLTEFTDALAQAVNDLQS